MNLKKFGKVFTIKFVMTRPSSYKKRIYRAAVSRRLRNTEVSLHSMLPGFITGVKCIVRFVASHRPVQKYIIVSMVGLQMFYQY